MPIANGAFVGELAVVKTKIAFVAMRNTKNVDVTFANLLTLGADESPCTNFLGFRDQTILCVACCDVLQSDKSKVRGSKTDFEQELA